MKDERQSFCLSHPTSFEKVRTNRQNTTRLRWAAWFGDCDLPLKLPSQWEIRIFKPKGGKVIPTCRDAVAVGAEQAR